MSKELDLKKKQVELKRVEAAREEMEMVIMERLHEIERVKASIKIQENREVELKQIIKELSNV